MENNLEKEKQNTKVDDEPLFIEKDHKGVKWFIIITIILLILGGALTFYYFKIYSNPMLVIGNIINDARKELDFSDAPISDIYKISGSIDLDLGFEDQSLQNIGNILNNIKLQYVISADDNNGYEALELYTKYEDEKLLNAKVILETNENLGYIYLEDLYDKYLHFSLDEEEIDDVKEINVDYEIITNGFVEALSKAINEDDFERDNDQTNINGSIEKVYRNSLIINRGNYQRIMKTLITELRNNDKFIDEINKLDKDIDFKEEFNTMLEEIDKEIFDDIIEINFYTKRSLKQELLKLEIVYNNEDGNNTISFTSTNDNEIIIDVFENNDNVMTIDIKLNGENTLLINVNFEDGNNHANIHFNMSYEELDKINKIDTKSSIDINKLTDNDLNTIIDNLSKNEALINLISDITNIFTLTM